MAKILFTWELGGGMGHVVPYLGVIDALQHRGHHVSFALRDPTRAGTILAPHGVRCLPAPIRTRPITRPVVLMCTFADILYNCGFDEPDLLRGLVEAWRSLFELTKPDMVVFDHSPTALLAARAFSFTKVITGTGFLIPPDASPLPNLRYGAKVDPKLLHAREHRVLATINAVLKGLTLAPLNRVTQLYTGADLNVFRTFHELDHYPERVGGHYWGCAPQSIGEAPAWPAVPGKKIFAYLKPFADVAKLLSALKSSGHSTLIYGDGLDPRLTRQFVSDTLVFSSTPVDMRTTAAQCDGAVLHGTHSTAINLLLAGKPMLQLPLTLEQRLFAQTVERLNAGITLRQVEPTAVVDTLKRLLEDGSRYVAGAKAFAARYADWDAHAQEQRLVSLLDECVTSVRGAPSMGRGRDEAHLFYETI